MSTAVAASLSPSEGSPRKAPIKLVPQGADCGTLQGRELAGADLSNLDLSGADLSGVNLSGTDFSGTTLFEADLSGAEMLGANLTGANLTRCNCHSVGLGNAELTEANFFGADLRNATLSGATLKDADLRTADLRGARLVEADLDGATFQSADLRDASLRRARCRGTVFDRVDFGGACLRELKDSATASWIEARISEVDFCGAYLLRRAICDQNYLHEFRRRGHTHAAIYWIWWLTSDCGRSLVRWGACIASVVFLFGLFFRVVAVDFGSHETWLSPYYYSLVTLTSLGYGDVLPVSVGAQAVAMAEVALGYMMLGGMLSIFSNMMARRAD
ncbi:MAG: pentapeptide repeat-containing protein [Nannocystaceae bacterium]|nr:pentapeptide repeat-containing protein [Nannocystaceae bacterium]